jgi:hypothetical protein
MYEYIRYKMSGSQIFKTNVSPDLLTKLLETNATKNNNHFIFTNDSYKKGIFNESISLFLEQCKPHYFESKQKYIERKLTYNSFTTILRQICNHNKITYTSQIKYDKSTYSIIYYIYF